MLTYCEFDKNRTTVMMKNEKDYVRITYGSESLDIILLDGKLVYKYRDEKKDGRFRLVRLFRKSDKK